MAGADQTLLYSRPTPTRRRAALAILPVAAVALLGNLATEPNIATWYAGLEKPGFTPPNWVFGPAWAVLYVMMAYAIWRVLGVPADRPGRSGAVTAYFLQLVLNAAWSWAFFAFHSPLAGLVVIVALLLAIVVTIRLFWPLDRLAAWLLMPYAAWVAYATVLNAAIWRLNG